MASPDKQLLAQAAQIVDMAKKAGADHVFAGASRNRSVELEVRDGKVETVKDSTSRGVGVEIYANGRYSSSSTSDLRPEQLAQFIADAVAMTRALQPDPHRKLPDPALFAGRPSPSALELVDPAVRRGDRDRRIAWAQEMNARVAGKDKVVSATSAVSDGHGITAAVSSNGFSGAYESTSVGMYTSITMRDAGDKRPASWYGTWATHVDELAAPDAIADEALRRTRARLGQAKGPTKKARMVVDNLSAGSLVRRLLGPAHGGSVQQKRSYWAERLGAKAVSELVTVTDDPLLPRGLSSRPFDGEGIAARRLPIIERGALKHFYLDTYYANKLDMKPTTGRSSNQIVATGRASLDDLLAQADGGIYVDGWLGGNMDSTTGDFSFGARGHLIENGALGAPVGEMNVTGNILGLFGSLVALGNDPWKYSSVRAPSMLFDGVSFSGI